MAIWDDVIPESDKEIYRRSGYSGAPATYGKKSALVIIDVTYDFVGDKPEPILKSQDRYPLSCGKKGWEAIYHMASLLSIARGKNLPIFYSVAEKSIPVEWAKRNCRGGDIKKTKNGNEIVKEIAPGEGDIVIRKTGPSIFLSTPLINVLTPLKVDTLLVCGGVTSGCIRASVVDAASYGFNVNVIEECTFDRGEVSHKVNLFDMNAKYASVVSITEVKDYLNKL